MSPIPPWTGGGGSIPPPALLLKPALDPLIGDHESETGEIFCFQGTSNLGSASCCVWVCFFFTKEGVCGDVNSTTYAVSLPPDPSLPASQAHSPGVTPQHGTPQWRVKVQAVPGIKGAMRCDAKGAQFCSFHRRNPDCILGMHGHPNPKYDRK